jgi:alpha-galactosidase
VTRRWTLRGATTDYVVGVPEHGGWAELVSWGPADVAPTGEVHFLPEADLAPLEYAAHGVRYGAPAELVVAGAECRPVFTGAREGDGTLVLEFADPVLELRLELHYRMPAGLDVVERWTEVHNDGSADLVLRAHDSAGFVVPTVNGARLRYLYGEWNREFQQAEVVLPRGRFGIGSSQGITGHSFSPYLAATDGESWWGVQLAWSGSWHLDADVDQAGRTRIQAGRALGGSGVPLPACASSRSPVAVGGCSTDGPDGLARVFHAYQRRLARDRPRPVIYNSWYATGFDVVADHQLELARRAARAGVEIFVLDDGWFTGRHDDTGGLGDWYADEQAFPGGLAPFVDRLSELGLGFGLWVEPESVSPSSELAAKHPEWILRTPGREPVPVRNQLLLDLGRDDVAEWVWQTLHRLISSYRVSYLKWDANRPRLDGGDQPGRDVDGEAVANLYRILDRLRTEHPEVYVEGCAGGGGRIDLGTAARVDTLWPSDNTAPLDRLRIQRGFLSGWSPHLLSSWVTDEPGDRGLDFRFHVAMAGGLGIGADLGRWTDDQLETARGWVDRYRAARDLVVHGEVHWLTAPDDPVVGLQYVGGDRSLVLSYDTGDSPPRRIPLRGLRPDRRYRIGDQVLTGDHLLTHGIPGPPPAESLCLLVTPTEG